MELFSLLMLLFLVVSAVAVSVIRSTLATVIVLTIYSLIMAILWQQLGAPDLAITEAAVGAGVTTVLFMLTLKRVGGLRK